MISIQKHPIDDIKTILTKKGLNGNDKLWQKQLDEVNGRDVERALATPAGSYSLEKLLALISPAAEDYLEKMAQLAQQLTLRKSLYFLNLKI